jgi:methyl-accepting chemotaxis protein
MSLNGWQKLSSVVKNIYAQEEDREKFISLSTEIVTSVKSFQSRERMSENIIEDTIIKYKKGEIKLNNEATTTSKLMNDSLEKLTNGRNIIEGVTDTVLSLNQRMGRIVDIVNEIESISDMTNMLALNASIEAARAGEQGKGFSVVAEEVSKLADQSQQSTGKIAEVIRGLIADVENVNNVIYRANDDIARGVAEFSRINKYIEDTALTAVLYERIISRERSHEREMKEREIAIMQNVNESMGIVEKNQDHGNEMKESISNHIREIEAIAGISDELNGLIQDLNTKTNQMISKAEVLQGLTEVKYEKGKTKK